MASGDDDAPPSGGAPDAATPASPPAPDDAPAPAEPSTSGGGEAAVADDHGERGKRERTTRPRATHPFNLLPSILMTRPASLSKVVVWLRPTGDAPILKQQRVRVPRTDPFARVVSALRTKTRAPAVLAYVREAFVPPLDAAVGDLADAYGSHGGAKLTVNYALAPAWG